MSSGHTNKSSRGVPLLPKTHPRMTADEYKAVIVGRAKVTESGCWEMPGFQHKLRGVKTHTKGYTVISYLGRPSRAHRVAYLLWKGAIPEGMEVCHKCDNPPCANPDHLFLGTSSENALDRMAKGRDRNRGRTRCIRGHELAGDNLLVRPTLRGYRRQCKTCQDAYHKSPEYKAWRREYQRMRRAAKRAHRSDEQNLTGER